MLKTNFFTKVRQVLRHRKKLKAINSPTMRILMICQRFPPYHFAGAELQALELSKSLMKLGIEVHVLSTRHEAHMPLHDQVDGISVTRVRTFGGRVQSVSQFFAAANYLYAHAAEYDVIHSHTLSATGLGALMISQLFGIPMIMKPSVGGPKGEIQKIYQSGFRYLLMPLLLNVNKLAVLNDNIVKESLRCGFRGDQLIKVINGVDLRRFYPLENFQKDKVMQYFGLNGKLIVLFVGRVVESKGIKNLLNIWPFIHSSIPNVTLVVAGTGDMDKAVRTAAKNCHSILPLGLQKDVSKLMQAADVLVLPSHFEAFGNVIIEALACGLPVVTTPVGVVPSLGLEGTAGVVLAGHSENELQDAIIKLLKDNNLRTVFARAAPKLAYRFDFDNVAKRYLDVYQGMLSNGNSTIS